MQASEVTGAWFGSINAADGHLQHSADTAQLASKLAFQFLISNNNNNKNKHTNSNNDKSQTKNNEGPIYKTPKTLKVIVAGVWVCIFLFICCFSLLCLCLLLLLGLANLGNWTSCTFELI